MKNPLDVWTGQWNPFKEFNSIQRGLNKFIEDNYSEKSLTATFSEPMFAPTCDVEETETQYLILFDLPGIDKNDVKIEVNENRLRVSGERKQQKREERAGRKIIERHFGSFERNFTLPGNIDPAKVEAIYTDGVLKLTVPKTMTSAVHQIRIGDGKVQNGQGQKQVPKQ